MDPREIAYDAFQKAIREEVRRNGRHRLDAQASGIIDWTIEDAGEELRKIAGADHSDGEVLAWIDAFVEHRLDQLRYLVELHERERESPD
jgi:hypothetical protein